MSFISFSLLQRLVSVFFVIFQWEIDLGHGSAMEGDDDDDEYAYVQETMGRDGRFWIALEIFSRGFITLSASCIDRNGMNNVGQTIPLIQTLLLRCLPETPLTGRSPKKPRQSMPIPSLSENA